MLKIIHTNKEINEKVIKEDLDINSNLLDFFVSEPKNISEKIYSTISEIKTLKKKELFYSKILSYLTFLLDSSSLKNDEKGKKVLKNLIEVCQPEIGIKIFQDLFYMLTEEKSNFPLKKEILLNEKISDLKEENDYITIYNLFLLYLIESKYDNDIISKFAELLEKNKNYGLLKKLENIEELRKIIREKILKEKDLISKDINISKLYFFLTLSSPDLVDEDLSLIKLNEKLSNEKNLMDNLENRNDVDILYNSDNTKYFDESYGIKGSELILRNAKESTIHEILIEFVDDEKQSNISIKEFIKRIHENEDEEKEIKIKDEEVQGKFEDIEEFLISGSKNKLYKIIINYLKKEIKVLYIRRCEYKKEQKEELLKKVKDVKSKLEGILKAIQKI